MFKNDSMRLAKSPLTQTTVLGFLPFIVFVLSLMFHTPSMAQLPNQTAAPSHNLVAWGDNQSGQLGTGLSSIVPFPLHIGNASNWKKISAGSEHTVAIKTDGTLWAWGVNWAGQLGDGSTTATAKPIQIGTANDWKDISVGYYHTEAIKTDGTLWAWGYNGYGQIGDGSYNNITTPIRIGMDNNWREVKSSPYHTQAIKTDGTLWAWGANWYGQLGNSSYNSSTTPIQIGTDNNWLKIATSYYHTQALKTDGTLWAWGYNGNGQFGDGTYNTRATPIQIGSETNWRDIAVNNDHASALKTDGTLWSWGQNHNGQLGDGTTNFRATPVQIGLDNNWAQISVGSQHTIARKTNGTLWSWGTNYNGQLGDGTITAFRTEPMQIGTDNTWQTMSAGSDYTVSIKTDGTLWGWGANWNGQLGEETAVKTTPTLIGTAKDWKQIGAGYQHTTAIKANGTLWAWGANWYGQLGDGTTNQKLNPTQIGTDNNWKVVSAGYYHTLAIKTDGTLWAWGANWYGQLGDGTTNQSLTPIQIGTDTDWKAISAGADFTIALKNNGTIGSWGGNYYGQLGNSSNTDYYWYYYYYNQVTPTQIGSDNNWTSITAGQVNTMAIKADGSLWAWGYNGYGALGNGTTSYFNSTPTQVGSENNWKNVKAGGMHTLALKTEGSLWAWGANYRAQLGINTITNSETIPTQVGTDVNWQQISAGMEHSLGIKADGSISAWGGNYSGQLGNGSRTEGLSPTQIGSDADWYQASAGGLHSIALKGDGVVAINPILTGNNALCKNETLELTANITGTATWSSSDAHIATVSATGLVTAVSAGTVTITYSVTVGSVTGTATKEITVNALPTVSITGLNATYCKSAAAITLAGLPAGGNFTIDGLAATTLDPSLLSVGNHTVIYNFTNEIGCSSSISQTVKINALPTVTITGLNATYCKSASTITLAGAPAGGNFTVDALAATTLTPSLLSVGNHTVVYNYSDGNGCFNTTSQAVMVNATPIFSIMASKTYMNAGETISLNVTPASAACTYQWSSNQSGNPISVTPFLSTTYTVTVTNILMDCPATTSTSITVYPANTFAFDPSKCYKITNKKSGKGLTVSANNTANNAPVILTTAVGSANQKWQFTTTTEGFVKIKGTQSGRFLGNNSTQNNTAVTILDYAADGGKDWKLEAVGAGFYRISHKKSGKSLDITNNSAVQDANAVTKNENSNDGQLFKIEEIMCDNSLSLVAATTTTQEAALAETNQNANKRTHAKADDIVLEKTIATANISEKPAYRAFGNATIFPNPAYTYFETELSFYNDKAVTIYLYNQVGALVATQSVENAGAAPLRMDVSNLNSGNYIVRIASTGTTDLMKKIVIMK